MANIRIKDLSTDSALSAGDYVVVDSASEGSRKFDLGAELSTLKEELNELVDNGVVPTSIREAITTLLSKAIYTETGLYDEIAILMAWASAVTAISISESSISISGLDTHQLSATTTPSGKTVSWSSSDTSVATVSNTGLVTSVGNGSCTITATSGEMSADCSCTVSGVTSYTITNTLTNATTNNASATIASGAEYTATLTPDSGRKFGASSVMVMMGSTDITSTAYSDGVVYISSVTDDVTITAYANEFDITALVYGTVSYYDDTRHYLYSFDANQKNRMTLNPCALKLVNGRSYTFSLGPLWSTFDSGVRILSGNAEDIASADFGVEQYVEENFTVVTASLYSSSWQHVDYTYTATADGQIFGASLKRQDGANFSDSDIASILANISFTESI